MPSAEGGIAAPQPALQSQPNIGASRALSLEAKVALSRSVSVCSNFKSPAWTEKRGKWDVGNRQPKVARVRQVKQHQLIALVRSTATPPCQSARKRVSSS
jgi:hypothetical protein